MTEYAEKYRNLQKQYLAEQNKDQPDQDKLNRFNTLMFTLNEQAGRGEQLPACKHECIDPVFELDCRTYGPSGFGCSRNKGHEGLHVACGATHNVESWSDDESK